MEKILFLCATKRGYEIIKYVNENYRDLIGCISTFEDIDVREKWNMEIIKYCKGNNISFIDYEELKNNFIKCITPKKITNIIAIGWKYLLPLHIVEYLKSEIIIFHDSLLPKYRGFSPTPTAVICGEKEIGLSVIFADESIDTGDIITQKSMFIGKDEYMGEIINKSINLYKKAIEELVIMIRNNRFSRIKQNDKEASYSIWRDNIDCKIDWSKSNIEIFNLIRAVSFPYMGAYTYMNEKKIIINKARIEDCDMNFAKRDSGKIWSISNNEPLIICGKGLLSIINAEYEDRNKVIFNKIRSRLV